MQCLVSQTVQYVCNIPLKKVCQVHILSANFSFPLHTVYHPEPSDLEQECSSHYTQFTIQSHLILSKSAAPTTHRLPSRAIWSWARVQLPLHTVYHPEPSDLEQECSSHYTPFTIQNHLILSKSAAPTTHRLPSRAIWSWARVQLPLHAVYHPEPSDLEQECSWWEAMYDVCHSLPCNKCAKLIISFCIAEVVFVSSVCLSVCLSVCRLSVCLSVCLCVDEYHNKPEMISSRQLIGMAGIKNRWEFETACFFLLLFSSCVQAFKLLLQVMYVFLISMLLLLLIKFWCCFCY